MSILLILQQHHHHSSLSTKQVSVSGLGKCAPAYFVTWNIGDNLANLNSVSVVVHVCARVRVLRVCVPACMRVCGCECDQDSPSYGRCHTVCSTRRTLNSNLNLLNVWRERVGEPLPDLPWPHDRRHVDFRLYSMSCWIVFQRNRCSYQNTPKTQFRLGRV